MDPGLGREIDFVPSQREIGGHLEVGVLHVEEIERVLAAGQQRIVDVRSG